jgi:hypothetical protein
MYDVKKINTVAPQLQFPSLTTMLYTAILNFEIMIYIYRILNCF